MTVAGDTSVAFATVWFVARRDANVTRITSGGRPMPKLFRVIDAATRDARRAEALVADASARRALRADPEGTLLAFELRAAVG